MTQQKQQTEMSVFGTITLGAMIKALEARPADQDVRFDFGYFVPDGLDSYRGWYDHLAIGYDDSIRTVQVGDLLKRLREAVGETFEGYKGGDYRMHEGTPVWVAKYSEAPSTAILGIADCDYMTVIQTGYVNV